MPRTRTKNPSDRLIPVTINFKVSELSEVDKLADEDNVTRTKFLRSIWQRSIRQRRLKSKKSSQ